MITGKDKEKMRSLELKLADSEEIIGNLKLARECLKEELAIIKEENNHNVAACSFEVDFDSLHAFSIERTILPKSSSQKSDIERTSIGYLSGGRIQEWIFNCSRETHERLAQEFKEYMKTKRTVQKTSEV
jgi:hypothetical protein